MPHAVFTEEGEAIEVNRHLDDDDPHDGNCTYIRNRHLLMGVRNGITPEGKPMIISAYYVLNPKTGIFVFGGMTTAEMPDYALVIKVIGEVEWMDNIPLLIEHPGMIESTFSLAPLLERKPAQCAKVQETLGNPAFLMHSIDILTF